MQNLEIKIAKPGVFVFVNFKKKPTIIPIMVLSTIAACVAGTFLPQLMPIWMAMTTRSWV